MMQMGTGWSVVAWAQCPRCSVFLRRWRAHPSGCPHPTPALSLCRPEVRVVILKAAGKAFCTGLDIQEAMRMQADPENAPTPQAVWQVQQSWSDTVRNMRRCPQPIICCVQGYAMGGGLALALGADIRLCTTKARFNVQMIKIGLTGCDIGISYFLPRLVGPSVAAELMYTGRMVSSERAVRIGLVSDVFQSTDDMEAAAEELADEMLDTNALALGLTKQGLGLNADAPSLDAALAVEDRQQTLMAVAPSGMVAALGAKRATSTSKL
eukprot:m.112323 g.112323  ORF g.112323 m.112323 type:complete len:267 (-) comp21414_c0_seq1:65-865(-)